jgi:DeoR family fructose operon transcriptional repressor
MACVDPWALETLAQSYVDVAFIATNGMSVQRGLTTPDQAEAAVKKAMVAAARRTVLLADHTKLSSDHLIRFAELSQIDLFISDTGLDQKVATEIELQGPRVVRA